MLCVEYMKKNYGARHAAVCAHVQSEAKAHVPDHLKADILSQIKELLKEKKKYNTNIGDGED